jgi:hypothetical protein
MCGSCLSRQEIATGADTSRNVQEIEGNLFKFVTKESGISLFIFLSLTHIPDFALMCVN